MRLLALGALVALLAAPSALAAQKLTTTPSPPVSPAASVYVEQVPKNPVSHSGESRAAGSTSDGSGGAPVVLIVVAALALGTLSAAVAFRTRSVRRRHA